MDVLHELIKTMSASERGYFKKYTSQMGGGVYVRLFDAIAGMDKYDEARLLKKFKKSPFVNHLARTKNYLYHSVIGILVQYHEESSPRIVSRNLLNEAEMLRNKGLLLQARKLIEKARLIAEEGEWYLNVLDALSWQKVLGSIGIYKPEELSIAQIRDEIKRVMKLLENLNAYGELSDYVHELARPSMMIREDEVIDKLNEVLKHPLLQNQNLALSLRTKVLYNYINCFTRVFLNRHREAFIYADNQLQLIKENPVFNASNPHILLDAYNTSLTVLQNYSREAVFEKYLYEFRDLVVKTSWLEAVKFQYYYSLSLSYFIAAGKGAEFLEAALDAREKLELYKGAIKDELRLSLYVALAEGYMTFGKYNDSVEIIELYRKDPPKNVRNDYQNYLLFFYLIAQYEKGNHLMVKNLVSNAGRFMKRKGEFSEIESLMLKVFDLLLKLPKSKERRVQLEMHIQKIKQEAETQGGRRWNNYLSFIVPFMESKIRGIQFHQYIQDCNNLALSKPESIVQ